MFSLPGLPAESITATIAYAFSFVLVVCALARLIRELFVDAKIRAETENIALSAFTPIVVIFSALSMYFYVLSFATQLSASVPEVPDMAAGWAAMVVALTDQVWRADDKTPMALSWFGAAFLLHFIAEFVRYILGAPARSRDKKRFNGALDSFEAQQRAGTAKEGRSPMKKGY